MAKMSGAQALVRQLLSEGVDTVFALPGVQIMAAFDALYEVRDRIRLVNTRHEQATTYMASGYARMTGKPGVALVVPGPGALNAAAGLATAYATSSPVMLIAGQIPSDTLGKRQGQLHEIEDQLDVFRPITKWNHRVTRMEEVPEAVHEAMRQMGTGRPRPVELEIPPDTLAATGEAEIVEPEEFPKEAGDPADLRRAAELLAGAKRPAIIAGGGATIAAASKELLELAELVQAPVMTSQQSKGVIDEHHYLAVGVHFSVLGPVYKLLPECDVVLAVGTRLLIRDLELPDSLTLIHIDADPAEIGGNYRTEVGIVADAKVGLGRLLELVRDLVPADGPGRGSRREEIEGHKREFAREMRKLAPDQTGMVDSIRAELDADAVVVSGVTNIGYWSNLAYPVSRPGTYLTSSYFATLGFAFPTALGAKVGRPEGQVVAICGDGGFMYSAEELSTAVRYGINVVALVFNNAAYGASRWDQTHGYGEHYIGTDLANPDFVKLAEAFGAVGMRTSPDGLGPALREALAADAPVVLEVEVPVMMPPFQVVQ